MAESQFSLVRVVSGEEVAVVGFVLGRRVGNRRPESRWMVLFAGRKCDGALDVSTTDGFDDLTV